jgi:hypothetical protein
VLSDKSCVHAHLKEAAGTGSKQASQLLPYFDRLQEDSMNRRVPRRFLLRAGICAAGAALPAGPASARPVVPGAVRLLWEKAIRIGVSSNPIEVNGQPFRLLNIGTATFHLADDGRLTAVLKAGVQQYSEVDYGISVAVFDGTGRLLGAAVHTEHVEYERLGRMPTLLREISFDFGISNDFVRAAYVVVAVTSRNVPLPPDALPPAAPRGNAG